jgi:tetratricopeptide (TPR) repeat protein
MKLRPARTGVRSAAAVVAMLLALTAVANAQWRKTIDDRSVTALRGWVDAVKSHTPGRADASVMGVAAYSYETREYLNTALGPFVAALVGTAYGTKGNKAAETCAALGHEVGRDFLKQAAVLHSDVAAYGHLNPSRPGGPAKAPKPLAQELPRGYGTKDMHPGSDPIPPLLMADAVLLDADGEVLGETASSWNWPFARYLLDLLGSTRGGKTQYDGRAQRATDPFVSAWYHATTAYMFASGLYGEATPHLHFASQALPDDAWSLFDRASYAEILGLPMHQALLTDAEQLGRSATVPMARSSAALRVPPAARTNAEAERLFRRAIEVDPSLVEARVRLARLLMERGKFDEAGAELTTALASKPLGVTAFYAHLFAGRAAARQGRPGDAAAHFAAATALFPDAQSALLGSSQLSLSRSDVAATLKPVAHLGVDTAVFTADPWWQYHLAAGRDAEALLRGMWAAVPR